MLSLPRLFTGWEKLPDTFVRYWNSAMSSVETNINNILTAQSAADDAQAAAEAAQSSADAAQTAASSANTNANTRVLKSAGPAWAAPLGTPSRAAYTVYVAPVASVAYDPVQMQALMDAMAAASQRIAAIITDLRSNQALTP